VAGRPENHLIALGDAHYPQLLLQISDPPPLLYVKGRRELEPSGTRDRRQPQRDAQGIANAEDFAAR
jgi:DNA processing protein